MRRVPEKLGTEYYRGLLTQQGRMFYDRINAQLLREDYSGKTEIPWVDPETAASDCFAAYKAVRDDHPEYFYLGFQSEFTRCGRSATLKYPILYSAENIGRIRRQLQKSIQRLVRGTAHLPMIERETVVYERIAKKLTYTNHGDVRDHNIVGPVLLSSGVCEGHNALLLLCFRQIGIPCIKVYGKTKDGGAHCWAIAWIHGIPVHCDVTWESAQDGIVCFDYLNLPDDQIARDHYGFQSVRIPECTSRALGYYRYHGLCVDSFQDLRARLRADLSRNVSPVRIHFSYDPPSGDYLKEVQKAFSQERIRGNHRLYYHPCQKNLALKTT